MPTLTEDTFEEMTLEEFNRKYRTEATPNMTIEEFTDYVEKCDIGYFYASYNDEDVIRAIKEDWDIAQKLNIAYLCVDGLYTAIY